MTARSEPADYAPANEAELHTLEISWAQGRLLAHADRIFGFIDRHRDEILALAGPVPSASMLLHTTKLAIVRQGSVCSASEMHDQAQQIRDEIWIRGERGDYDRKHIAHEWASRHAANWRRWRLKEYLFVVDRCAEDIARHLNGREAHK